MRIGIILSLLKLPVCLLFFHRIYARRSWNYSARIYTKGNCICECCFVALLCLVTLSSIQLRV